MEPRKSTNYGSPNAVDTWSADLALFLCKEAVDAAKTLGLLKSARPVPKQLDDSDSLVKCKLTGQTHDIWIAEIRYGTDENTMRNIVVRMFDLSPVLK